MKKFIRSSRPKQMTKNLLIFVPLFFTIDTWISYSYTDIQIIISKSIFTFFSFCCCSIIGYQINDFIDRNLDKFHSVKKNRPIAKRTFIVHFFDFYCWELLCVFSKYKCFIFIHHISIIKHSLFLHI